MPDRPFTKVPDELLEALAKCGAPAAVFRLVLAIIRETYGYGEPARKIRRKRLGEMMGVKEARVRQILQQAKDLNMVTVEGWSISVQEDHSQWPKPIACPIGFRNRQRTAIAFGETDSGVLPGLEIEKPIAQRCRENRQRTAIAQRHRQETGTSTSPPQDLTGPSEAAASASPRGGEHGQLVHRAWQLLGLPDNPPRGAYSFAGKKRKAKGLNLMRDWVAYLEKHGAPEPYDDSADPLGWYKDAENFAMACRPGQGWRGAMEREGKIEQADQANEAEIARQWEERNRKQAWSAACKEFPEGFVRWKVLKATEPDRLTSLTQEYQRPSTEQSYRALLGVLEAEMTSLTARRTTSQPSRS